MAWSILKKLRRGKKQAPPPAATMVTAPHLPDAKAADLAENGQELPREVVEIMARKLGPGSAPEAILKQLDEHEPRGFKGHVILDRTDDSLIILWEPVLPGEETASA